MATNKKCKHPSCNCQAAADSDYCSTECEAVGTVPDIDCRCPHQACQGRTH